MHGSPRHLDDLPIGDEGSHDLNQKRLLAQRESISRRLQSFFYHLKQPPLPLISAGGWIGALLSMPALKEPVMGVEAGRKAGNDATKPK